MSDLTIHGVDDDLVERYRVKAAQSGKSLNECLREALERAALPIPAQRAEVSRRIRAMTPGGESSIDSTEFIRAARDTR